MKRDFIQLTQKNGSLWVIGTLVIVLLSIIIRSYLLKAHPRYTEGITAGIYYTGTGAKKVKYFYFVNGVRYENSDRYMDNVIADGGKYWVKFSSKAPSSSAILFSKPIPKYLNEMITIPPEGLRSLPEGDR